MRMIRKPQRPGAAGVEEAPSSDGMKPAGETPPRVEGFPSELRFVRVDSEIDAALLESGSLGIGLQPADVTGPLEADPGVAKPPAGTATALNRQYDLAMLNLIKNEKVREALAVDILKQRLGLSEQHKKREAAIAAFQQQRTALMQQAVAATVEVTKHLVTWRHLAVWVVPILLVGAVTATFFVMYRLLNLVAAGRINGVELALLFFVLALVAVSPATLLLLGRPLKGLEEWSPGKTLAEEPAADDDDKADDDDDKADSKPAQGPPSAPAD